MPARGTSLLWPIAFVAAALLVWGGSQEVFWAGDFMGESWGAYSALQSGDLQAAWDRSPAYLGFAVLVGVPSALLAAAFGGEETAVFRLVAAPGALALAALLALLVARGGGSSRAQAARFVLLAAAVGPIAYQALVYGHPEDLLAAAGCVAAVLLAHGGRPLTAALVVVLAVAVKQWAVLAIGPVLLAAPRAHVKLALVAFGGSGLAVAAMTFAHPLAQSAVAIPAFADFFHPQQLWWPFGVDAPAAWTAAGHGTKVSPAWLRGLPHVLIVAVGFALSGAWWLARRGRERALADVLALLALVFALRCLLDPWNLVYYHLPLVLCLAAWETVRGRPQPVLALAVSAATWLSFVVYDAREGMGPFVLYLAWVLPLLWVLGRALWPGRTAVDSSLGWRSVSSPPASPTAPA